MTGAKGRVEHDAERVPSVRSRRLVRRPGPAGHPRPASGRHRDDDNPLAWQSDALCAQTDPEAFFPEKGGSTRDAKKICTTCEVKAPVPRVRARRTTSASASGAACPSASAASCARPAPPDLRTAGDFRRPGVSLPRRSGEARLASERCSRESPRSSSCATGNPGSTAPSAPSPRRPARPMRSSSSTARRPTGVPNCSRHRRLSRICVHRTCRSAARDRRRARASPRSAPPSAEPGDRLALAADRRHRARTATRSQRLLAAVEVAPSVAIAGPKVVDADDRDLIRSYGESLSRVRRDRETRRGRARPGAARPGRRRARRRRRPACSCSARSGRGSAGSIRGLPTVDAGLDFSIRARLAGFRVIRVAGARVSRGAPPEDLGPPPSAVGARSHARRRERRSCTAGWSTRRVAPC